MIGFRTALAAPLALRRASRVRATPQTRRGNDTRFVVRAEIRRIASPDGTVPDLPNVTFKPPPIVDRAACKSGMMHIGVGGFHRSHQQVRAATPNRAQHLASLRGRKRPRNTSHVELPIRLRIPTCARHRASHPADFLYRPSRLSSHRRPYRTATAPAADLKPRIHAGTRAEGTPSCRTSPYFCGGLSPLKQPNPNRKKK